MRKSGLFFLILSTVVNSAFGLGLGAGGYYLVGFPAGEAKISEYLYGRDTSKVTTDEGIPFKKGLFNFGGFLVINLVAGFDAEVGFEIHNDYKNEGAWVIGKTGGETWGFYENEDNVSWSLRNVYIGGRYNIPTGMFVRPFADCGYVRSISIFEPEESWGGSEESVPGSLKGKHKGLYFGGGVNLTLSNAVAVTLPVKFTTLSTATYKYDYSVFMKPFEETWNPPDIFTVGAGFQFRIF